MVIAVIRIKGQTNVKSDVKETLHRLRIRKKLACVLVEEKDVIRLGMIKSVMQYVIYGKISEELADKIKKARGQKDVDGKLKPFFRLHPPRGGFKKSTKILAPKGVLGENKDIDKLIERML